MYRSGPLFCCNTHQRLCHHSAPPPVRIPVPIALSVARPFARVRTLPRDRIAPRRRSRSMASAHPSRARDRRRPTPPPPPPLARQRSKTWRAPRPIVAAFAISPVSIVPCTIHGHVPVHTARRRRWRVIVTQTRRPLNAPSVRRVVLRTVIVLPGRRRTP